MGGGNEEERCLFVNSVWVVVVTVGNGRVHGHFAKFKLLISSELYRNVPKIAIQTFMWNQIQSFTSDQFSREESKMPGAGLEECCLLSFQESIQKCLFCPTRLQSRSLVSTDPPPFQEPAVTVSHTSVTENISVRLPRPFEVKSLPHTKVASVSVTLIVCWVVQLSLIANHSSIQQTFTIFGGN